MDRIRIFLQDHMTSFRTILAGFLVLILAGACLLCLPVSAADGTATPFAVALFTSTSAACVTGLVAVDTASHWSMFGRAIILVLIQIGGLGVVTVATVTWMLTGKRIGILQRSTMQDAISAPQIGGIIRFAGFVIKGTMLVEGIGMLCLWPVFARDFGVTKGFGHALFHSVSAFCNAGFDLMGVRQPFSSLTYYRTDVWLNAVIMALIIIGGIGFLTWQDLLANKFHLRRLRLQTKIILLSTLCLLVLPFAYFLFVEFADLPLKERILSAAFQTVTPRTAGFNTEDYGSMSEGGLLITAVLMLTGGAPGSTAGGLKVTTIFILAIAANSYLFRREDVNCFKRRLDYQSIQNAFALLMVYLTLLMTGTIVISHVENLPVIQVLFECASALGTVGLTVGITPSLSFVSRMILIAFMYFGRIGGLTLAYAAVSGKKLRRSRYPAESVSIG